VAPIALDTALETPSDEQGTAADFLQWPNAVRREKGEEASGVFPGPTEPRAERERQGSDTGVQVESGL